MMTDRVEREWVNSQGMWLHLPNAEPGTSILAPQLVQWVDLAARPALTNLDRARGRLAISPPPRPAHIHVASQHCAITGTRSHSTTSTTTSCPLVGPFPFDNGAEFISAFLPSFLPLMQRERGERRKEAPKTASFMSLLSVRPPRRPPLAGSLSSLDSHSILWPKRARETMEPMIRPKEREGDSLASLLPTPRVSFTHL